MIALDKQKHFFYGIIFSLFGIFWLPLCALGFILGIVKELYDLQGYGNPEWKDMLYTWLGALIGTILCLL
jgi:hypothetical protein